MSSTSMFLGRLMTTTVLEYNKSPRYASCVPMNRSSWPALETGRVVGKRRNGYWELVPITDITG